MTHGFDDQGRQFDKDGNMNNWWTEEDAAAFKQRTDILVEQFNKVLISSEICGLIYEDPITLAEKYGKEICEDFNNFTSYFCDWNQLVSIASQMESDLFRSRSAKWCAVVFVWYDDWIWYFNNPCNLHVSGIDFGRNSWKDL